MAWTYVFTDNQPGAGEVFEYGTGIAYHVKDYGSITQQRVNYWDGSTLTTLLEIPVDIPNSALSARNRFFKLNGNLFYAMINSVSGKETFEVYKYSGTPRSWTNVFSYDTLLLTSSFTVSLGIGGGSASRILVNLSESTLSRTYITTDGETYTLINNLEDDFPLMDPINHETITGSTYSDTAVYAMTQDTALGHLYLFYYDTSWVQVEDITTRLTSPTLAFVSRKSKTESYVFNWLSSEAAVNPSYSPQGGTWTTDTGQALNYDIYSTANTDFYVPSPSTNLYYNGIAGNFLTLLDTLPLPTGATSGTQWIDAVVRVGNDLYVHAGAYIGATLVGEWYKQGFSFISDNEKILSVSTPFKGGTEFWVTTLTNGSLYAKKIDFTTRQVLTSYLICTASEAELAAHTWEAHVYAFEQDRVVLFGRMSSPLSLTGTQHVIQTLDGGTTWTSVESGWGVDSCSAFVMNTNGEGLAIRTDVATEKGSLYYGSLTLLKKMLDLDIDFRVPYSNLSFSVTGSIALTSDATETSKKVLYILPPYDSQTNLTFDHPLTEVKRIDTLI